MVSLNVDRPTRARHTVVAFAVALAVITYIDRVSISFAAPDISRDLRLSTTQMGWAFAAFSWAYAIFEIPGGFLGDWIGPRKVLLRIVLWWSLFTAATGWVWNVTSLLAVRFFFGVGEAGCFPNLTKIFSVWLPEKEKVRAQGVLWLSARWGGAFTPPLVALVMAWIGWRHAFEIFGVLGVVWGAAFYRWFLDNPLEHPALNPAERELLAPSAALGGAHSAVPWSLFLSSGRVWLLCWQYFSFNYGFYFYITWLPTYMREGRHLAVASTALLGILPLFFGGVANAVSVYAGERLTQLTGDLNRSRRIVACCGFGGACASMALSTLLANPVHAVLAIAAASFFGDLIMPHSWGAAMDMGGKYSGTLSGMMNMWGNIGGAVCPLVIGYVLAWTGNNWNLTLYITSIVYAAGILCWLFLDSSEPLE
jgi:MFS transporter, ACS family, glucarate transporter